MGADIHMYVEYRNKKQAKERETRGDGPYWISYGDGMNPGRNYTMFAVLAGVRGQYTESFEPKGKIPRELMGWSAKCDAFMNIYPKKHEDKEWEGFVTSEKATEWETWGRRIILNENGEPTHIEHPDWHSHSWMNIRELEKAYKIYAKKASKEWNEKITKPPVEWMALLASMKALEDGGKNEVRVVFWFDS